MPHHDDKPPAPVLPGEEIAPGVRVLSGGMEVKFSRSSGPGGQNVNKVNTKCDLWVDPAMIAGLPPDAMDRLRVLAAGRINVSGRIHIAADHKRTAESNRQAALDVLRELVLQARVRPKIRRKTKPSRAAKRRRVDEKKRRGEIKRGRGGAVDHG